MREAKRPHKKIILLMLTALLFLTGLSAILVLTKRIHLNNFFIKPYPVRGVDVSHYQGDIDWNVIESQNI